MTVCGIEWTEKDKEIMATLGKRFKKEKEKPAPYKLPDKPVNEMFFSLGGVDDSYSFRGIVADDDPYRMRK